MPLGRPIEFNPDHVVNAAMLAFWSKGYEATSLSDLLETTKLSKSSFYQSFGSKKEMFHRCVMRYTDDLIKSLRTSMAVSPTPLTFIHEMLMDCATEGAHTTLPLGCLNMNTASEFGQREPEFSAWVAECMARVHAVFVSAIEHGQAMGEVTSRQSAPVLATYVMTSRAGVGTMVKAGTPPAMMLSVVEVVVAALRAD
ncbi:MAG: TetR/AcrR family transcriptional regulator [Burkholderiaceae bacterium]|nr:TetR/AcrR family transcriptional regulator [Burkholderiaceae bacterium]MDZ4146481.1 TetR/AcrR family transcriptional regulator [Burkholderiales bacterium]